LSIDLKGRVSSKDLENTKSKRNKPEYEPGFEPGGDDFDDINFDDLELNFGDDDIFGGGNEGGNDLFGESGGASADPFSNPFTSGGSPFSPPTDKKKDLLDETLEKSGDALGALGRIISATVKNLKSKDVQSIGLYAKNLIVTGGVISLVGLSLGLVGAVSGVKALHILSMPLKITLTGLCTMGIGSITIAIPGYIITESGVTVKKADKIESDNSFDFDGSDFGDSDFDGSDFGGSDFGGDALGDIDDNYSDNEDDDDELFDFSDIIDDIDKDIVKDIDYDKVLDSVPKVAPIMSRAFLVETFKDFLPKNTPNFSDRREIIEGSEEFAVIETICLKALASANNTEYCDFDTDKYYMENAFETMFTYDLKVTRVMRLTNLPSISKEIVAYFREDSEDDSITADVALEGDFYRIIIYKGAGGIITLGDVLGLDSALEFFKDESNKLPFCVGILPDGKPLLKDARRYDTMLIAGKPRSGKTWATFNIALSLMAFNTPEDIQFVIIDPKKSALLTSTALMPHVCGIHDDSNIIELFEDIVYNEGERRSKLLLDHNCDDIWSFREETGIKLPLLYIFVDEFMSVLANLSRLNKDKQNEFNDLMKIIISQLPSKGIRLVFVPHRAQGVVDKTIRSLIGFNAAVQADQDVVLETLGVKKFDKTLSNPGDTAVMMQGDRRAMFVKGTAIDTSDTKNKELITSVAKAFYKMGVEIPDMRTLKSAFNRDEEEIKKELLGEKSGKEIRLEF